MNRGRKWRIEIMVENKNQGREEKYISEQIEGVCKTARQSDTKFTTNPSKESILIKMEALFNDPENMDIKMTSTIVNNRSQGMRDNVQNWGDIRPLKLSRNGQTHSLNLRNM
jgi:hypothetical protein